MKAASSPRERHLEDLAAGQRFKTGAHRVTEKEIVAFARQFDPQPFHTEPAAAKDTVFQGLAASGWHTAAISMRLYVTGELKVAGGHVGLGVEELSWPRPVRPGDELKVETEILDVRPSRSKPDRGIVKLRSVTTNQNGDVVQSLVANILVPRRRR